MSMILKSDKYYQFFYCEKNNKYPDPDIQINIKQGSLNLVIIIKEFILIRHSHHLNDSLDNSGLHSYLMHYAYSHIPKN